MPVRSSSSSVLRWPDAEDVHDAAAAWAERERARRPEVEAIGYAGSYARGDWGPGSDLDLVVIIRGEIPPIGERARTWATGDLPVPVDLLLFSAEEWRDLLQRSPRWARVVEDEMVWLTPPGAPPRG